MARDVDKLNFHPGDPLRARDLQAIVKAIRTVELPIRGGPGIVIRQGMQGQIEISAVDTVERTIGVANGNITARSGTTVGTGIVRVWRLSGTTLFDNGVDQSVNNASAEVTAGGNGIDSGVYVWIMKDRDGIWWVSPLECTAH
jgi:hypothetical protein